MLSLCIPQAFHRALTRAKRPAVVCHRGNTHPIRSEELRQLACVALDRIDLDRPIHYMGIWSERHWAGSHRHVDGVRRDVRIASSTVGLIFIEANGRQLRDAQNGVPKVQMVYIAADTERTEYHPRPQLRGEAIDGSGDTH